MSDFEPGRLVTQTLAAFQREYEAELQVALDRLAELGWPPGRLIHESGPIGVDRDYTLLIKRGIEMANDLPVFRVKTKIGGGSLRYWCGWMLPPEHLPIPSAQTIALGELAEASWKRSTLSEEWVEDERPIGEREVERVQYMHGRPVMRFVDEWSNMTPAQIDAFLAARKS